MGYAWVITTDHFDSSDRGSEGVIGPRSAKLSKDEIVNHPDRKFFTMKCDDGHDIFSGYLVGSDTTGFEPLDDFGMPDSGCTEIWYLENGKMVQL